jgi:hypothetical protein
MLLYAFDQAHICFLFPFALTALKEMIQKDYWYANLASQRKATLNHTGAEGIATDGRNGVAMLGADFGGRSVSKNQHHAGLVARHGSRTANFGGTTPLLNLINKTLHPLGYHANGIE